MSEVERQVVNIRRSGNVLEIDPGRLDVLGPVLTYQHRSLAGDYGYNPTGHRGVETTDRELYRVQGDKIYTLQGAYKRVVDALTKAGCECVYTDLRSKTLEPDYAWFAKCMPDLEFRLKQDEILATLIGQDSGIIVAPTAYGKTFIMLALTALYPKAHIIMASPSTALLRSTYNRILKLTGEVGRVGGGHCEPRRVTLCTFGSLMRAPIDKCDILLIDESHAAAAPKISADIARIRAPVKIFGMTATPKGRSDNAHLPIEVMIGPMLTEVEYDEAVDAGMIAPIKVGLIEMPVDSCHIHSYDYATKPAKKRNCYWRNTPRNTQFAEAVQTYPAKLGMPDNVQILVLTETIEHAFRMARLLPDFQVVYANLAPDRLRKLKDQGLVADDYRPLSRNERDRMLQQFEAGEVRKVIATGCWGTGVDFVNLDVVVNISGARSPISTVQWAGRNSRVYTGKSFGLLIDSCDKWDTWAKGRADARLAEYRKKKWELLKGL